MIQRTVIWVDEIDETLAFVNADDEPIIAFRGFRAIERAHAWLADLPAGRAQQDAA